MAEMSLSRCKVRRTMDPNSRPSLNKCCWSERRVDNRINALPDDVLISIISRLNLKDVARTSVLSRKWRHLWTHTTGILEFDKSILDPSETRLIDWVNQVLNVHKGSTIDEFKVRFGLSDRSSDVVNRWIKFALERRVKRFFLDFRQIKSSAADAKFSLKIRVFDNCPLGSLTCLNLKNVDMSDEVCRFILSSFPLLQILHLNSVSSLKTLTISDLSSHLRSLKIKRCQSLNCLEVHAVNLVSLTYHGPKVKKFLKEAPRVVEANTENIVPIQRIDNFSSCFSRLESLKIDLRDWRPLWKRITRRDPKLPKFEKLNYLEFSWSSGFVKDYIRMFTNLLKASPLLQTFVFTKYEVVRHFPLFGVGAPKVRREKYQHRQLKVIEFREFGGSERQVDLALRLCAMLPGLETLVVETHSIYPFRQFENGDFGTVAKRARNMLELLPKRVKLVIE